MSNNNFQSLREKMIATSLRARGIEDEKLLWAMNQVQREKFVSEDMAYMAYEDCSLPIECEQTISQPYVVAYMIEALKLTSQDRVLEIGTGSGYNAAVMSYLAKEIYSVEINEPLGVKAKALFEKLSYKNIHVQISDGYKGWPEHAPFNAIILTAAPLELPQLLVDQLAEGGRLIAPVGKSFQKLLLVTKKEGKTMRTELLDVRFVPMINEAAQVEGSVVTGTKIK